jgi:tRNA(fMet)-specific endonuclease VapC
MYILDTDHLGILQGPRNDACSNVLKRIADASDSNVFTTIISFHEIVAGWTKYVKQSNDPQKIVAGYARLEQVLKDFSCSQVLPFSLAASEVFEDLRRTKIRVATMDLRIASIAISQQMTVVTRNTVDYARIPGLALQDWTTTVS